MKQRAGPKKLHPSREEGITRISVSGFKSISQKQSIEIRPLTILAGANSSGKSSMIQPLLLLKQTLEETYDPGPLLLYGPNAKFTSVDQLLSRIGKTGRVGGFEVGINLEADTALTLSFSKKPDKKFEIQKMSFSDEKGTVNILSGMTHEEAEATILSRIKSFYEGIPKAREGKWLVVRNRCFLELTVPMPARPFGTTSVRVTPSDAIERHIRGIIHLPGLRGNPERSYPVAAVGPTFPGTFEKYVASVIAQWQTEKDHDKLEQLSRALEKLGLTWKVTAKPVDDTQVELQVGRLSQITKGRARDLVNLADVGLGVSQTLPVLVALQTAEPDQLVYLEHPELHLHPRAQFAMAQILANAANRGGRVVVETHSSLLLLGVQALVAEGKLAPEKVKLHWFKRDSSGNTKVSSADLDEKGAFGDWPEDFADVALETESRYLDAAEAWGRKNGYGGKKVETPRH